MTRGDTTACHHGEATLRPHSTCQRLGAADSIGDLGLEGCLHQKANADIGLWAAETGPDERSLPPAPLPPGPRYWAIRSKTRSIGRW